MSETVAENAANNPDLVQAHIAGYQDANSRLREVAKWFVTSAAAVAALLVGTSPLSGLSKLGWSTDLVVPLLFGGLAVTALGSVVFVTSRVLAPSTVELNEVAKGTGFTRFRGRVDADPQAFFGPDVDSLADFLYERTLQFKSMRSVMAQLSSRATPKANLPQLEEARVKLQTTIDRHGWVVQRLLAAAENQLLWERFRQVRIVAAAATAATIVGLVGFLVSVNAGATADAVDGPLPVTVSLTDTGLDRLGGLLGPTCPTSSFEALLTSGGKTAPWEIMVVDPDCSRGTLTVTGGEGRVLFVP